MIWSARASRIRSMPSSRCCRCSSRCGTLGCRSGTGRSSSHLIASSHHLISYHLISYHQLIVSNHHLISSHHLVTSPHLDAGAALGEAHRGARCAAQPRQDLHPLPGRAARSPASGCLMSTHSTSPHVSSHPTSSHVALPTPSLTPYLSPHPHPSLLAPHSSPLTLGAGRGDAARRAHRCDREGRRRH
jgi:hypothetical protein